MRRIWLLGVVALVAVGGLAASLAVVLGDEPDHSGTVTAAAALGNGFTYQGRLTDGGSPPTGTYDFEFKLFDSLTGGIQVGVAQTANDVVVTAGLFTTQLDFGAAAFAGDARWIEIGVRAGTSTGGYQQLLPRQPITPAPHSLFAKLAAALALPFAGSVNSTGNALAISNSSLTGSGASAIRGETDSTAGNVSAIIGHITSPAPGGFSAGVRGTNDGTGGNGIGVFGEQAGSGWGVYGTSPSGRGVYGFSASGAGVYGASSTGNAGVFVGDVQVSGKISKTYGSTPSQAIPIAFGYVDASGALISGTSNVTTSLVGTTYRIAIAGEAYFFANYAPSVTPVDSPRIASTGSVSNQLTVSFVDLAGAPATSRFYFVVYKP